jgi:hypothetical protein
VKKLIAIAFTCVYLLLTVGVIKNTHYCMGRINTAPASFRTEKTADQTEFQNPDLKNTPEFFILSELYSEALVKFLA